MHDLMSILWRHIWQVSLLVPLMVLVVRWFLPRSPHLGYALLAVVLLKCLVPPVISTQVGLFCWLTPPPEAAVVASSETMIELEQESYRNKTSTTAPATESQATTTSNPVWSIPWLQIALTFWGIGAILITGYLIGKLRQLRRFHEETQLEPSDELLEMVEMVAWELHLKRTPRVLITLHPTVPFATGIFEQWVVLPSHVVNKAKADELQLVLAHEMTHLRRGDMLVSALQLIVQTLWWFHPFVWWLNQELRRIREQCCDQEVVTRLECVPKTYAHCLISVLEMKKDLHPTPGLAGLSPVEVTAERLEHIMSLRSRPKSAGITKPGLVAAALVAVLVVPGGALPARDLPVQQVAQESFQESELEPTPNEPVPQVETRAESTSSEVNDLAMETQQAEPTEAIDQQSPPRTQAKSQQETLVRYRWENVKSLPFQVSIQAQRADGTHTHRGSPVLHLVEGGNDISTWRCGQPDLTESFQPKRFDTFAPPRMRPPNFSYPSFNENLLQIDSRGRVASSGPFHQLPYHLGTLPGMLFPRLPKQAFDEWEGVFSSGITIQDQSDYPFPSRVLGSSETEQLTTEIKQQLKVLKQDDDGLEFERTFHLVTLAEVDGQPQIELNYSGTLRLDVNHLPLSVNYTGKLIERQPNVAQITNLKIEISRLNPSAE